MSESLVWRIVLIALLVACAAFVLVWHFNSEEGLLRLGFDLEGGVELRYRLKPKLEEAEKADLTEEEIKQKEKETAEISIQKAMEVLQERLDPKGVAQLDIRSEGSGEIIIRLAGKTIKEVKSIKYRAEQMGRLEFREVVDITPEAYEKLPEEEKRTIQRLKMKRQKDEPADAPVRRLYVRTHDEYDITGEDLKSAFVDTDENLSPAVGFQFKGEGAKKFAAITKKLAGKGRLAILFEDPRTGLYIQSAPVVKSIIHARGIITGDFTIEEVENLVRVLDAGSLPVPIELQSETYVGPELGEDSRARGYLAVKLAFGFVVAFMLVYYMTAGTIADLALALNLMFLFAALMLTEAVLTLPGMAGVILTVGMAVDANVLIYERVREELKQGQSLRFAIKNGYGKAFWTIFDANLTTLITGVILYWLASGPIRGFAVTLCLGIVISMFTALVVTRTVFDFLIYKGWMKEKLSMLTIVKKSSIRFVRWTPFCLTASFILIAAGIATFVYRGADNYGIDFSAGISMHVKLTRELKIDEVRRMVADAGYGNADVQTASKDANAVGLMASEEFTIRVREEISEGDTEATRREKREAVLTNIENAFIDMVPHEAVKAEVFCRDVAGTDGSTTGKTRVTVGFFKQTTEGGESRVRVPLRRSYIERALKKAGFEAAIADIDWGRKKKEHHEVIFETVRTDKEAIRAELEKKDLFGFPDAFIAHYFVGPSQASRIIASAWKAALLSLIAIIAYVWLRFGALKYGLAAVAALAHDVLFALGALAAAAWLAETPIGETLGIGDVRLSLPIVAGILMIIGYSLNDTIVVFDRIRENVRKRIRTLRGSRQGGEALTAEVIDRSINQTLSRTLLTSMTTLIVCLTLYFVGGMTLHGMALCLTIGVLVGTYSSIFIASPILVLAHAWELRRARAAGRMTTEEKDVADERGETFDN